jgi:hypothetical protein
MTGKAFPGMKAASRVLGIPLAPNQLAPTLVPNAKSKRTWALSWCGRSVARTP